ncbi:MAG: hypothetical protein J6J36_03085 [Clostridia bacterium]|nr:hypothetical protein [Clostridia bacterium]
MENEKSYLIFVLGYDFLNVKLNNLECDLAFEKCEKIIDKFMKSEEYLNLKCGVYDTLGYWLQHNEKVVNKVLNENMYEYKEKIITLRKALSNFDKATEDIDFNELNEKVIAKGIDFPFEKDLNEKIFEIVEYLDTLVEVVEEE